MPFFDFQNNPFEAICLSHYFAVIVLLIMALYFTYCSLFHKKTSGFCIFLTLGSVLAMLIQSYVMQVAGDVSMSWFYDLKYPMLLISITLICTLIQVIVWIRQVYFLKAHKHLKKQTFAKGAQWLEEEA